MTAFVDSSALVKLYVPETGHEAVRTLAPPLVISQLARVEVPAAFWRKHRIGELDPQGAAALSQAFASDFVAERYVRVDVTPAVLDDAARLVAVHPLRAYDAIQLSSALAASRVLGAATSLAAFDRSLRSAASAEGLNVVPPLDPM